MRRTITMAVLAGCLLGIATAGGAKELKRLDSDPVSKPQVGRVDLSRYETKPEGRKPANDHDYGVVLVPDDPISVADPEPEFTGAFEHFNAYDDGNSLTNAYLCDYLSEAIYSDTLGYSEGWDAAFRAHLMAEGAEDVTFTNDATYGAELAAVWLDDAVIIVCRGSHINGSEAVPWTDWVVDFDDDAIQKEIGGYKCHVHEGAWNATSSVYNWIRATATAAVASNKRVWITGHSLGAATGTLAAARLHYADGIPVQCVHTFGSYKVGDGDFKKLMQQPGADGEGLYDYTQRWAVNGDFATTLFWRDLVPFKTKLGGFYVYYEHVGRTHQITRSGTLFNPDWEVDFDTEENTGMIAFPHSLLPGGQHGEYVPALRKEIERRLSTPAWEDVLDDLLRL